MKDYSAMSDQQINMAVGLSFGEKIGEAVNGLQIVNIDAQYLCSQFDPCNNPADAWPIIQERGISLNYDGIDWIAFDIFTETKASNNIETHAGKPLRAAMICYLRALDAEKGHG